MDVDSDSDAASSASIRSETMGLPLADAIEPFPGGSGAPSLTISTFQSKDFLPVPQ